MFHRRFLRTVRKRGSGVGKTKRGKGSKIMAIADAAGLPIAIDTGSASPLEVTLVEQTLEARFIDEVPEKLIGDKAYDSDALDEQMEVDYGLLHTEAIASSQEHRMAESCAVTANAGKSNAFLPGYRISEDASSVMNTTK